MRKHIWIIAALAVAFAAFACDGDDGNGTSATSTPAAPATGAVSPTTAAETPTSSAGDGQPAIIIDEPGLGDIVQIPFEISGTADVFEAALTVQVLNADGALVCQHNIMATSGSGTRGNWATTMAFAPPVPPSGNAAVPMVVRALSYSAKDGSEENVVTVDVNVSGERPPNTIDTPACGARVPVSAPLAVSGTTDAFEGSLQLELQDASGAAVLSQTVQAAGGTGDAPWSASLSLAGLDAGAYMLIAFDFSAQDGTRQNEFAIPVELMAP
jgi:hypothetical protein